jgi:hypothetical protein
MRKLLLLAIACACAACVREVVLEPDAAHNDGNVFPDAASLDGLSSDGGTDGIPPDAAPSD